MYNIQCGIIHKEKALICWSAFSLSLFLTSYPLCPLAPLRLCGSLSLSAFLCVISGTLTRCQLPSVIYHRAPCRAALPFRGVQGHALASLHMLLQKRRDLLKRVLLCGTLPAVAFVGINDQFSRYASFVQFCFNRC